jgi:hypothetical protein
VFLKIPAKTPDFAQLSTKGLILSKVQNPAMVISAQRLEKVKLAFPGLAWCEKSTFCTVGTRPQVRLKQEKISMH